MYKLHPCRRISDVFLHVGFQTAYWLNVTFVGAKRSDPMWDIYFSPGREVRNVNSKDLSPRKDVEDDKSILKSVVSDPAKSKLVLLEGGKQNLNHEAENESSSFTPFPSQLFMWQHEPR